MPCQPAIFLSSNRNPIQYDQFTFTCLRFDMVHSWFVHAATHHLYCKLRKKKFTQLSEHRYLSNTPFLHRTTRQTWKKKNKSKQKERTILELMVVFKWSRRWTRCWLSVQVCTRDKYQSTIFIHVSYGTMLRAFKRVVKCKDTWQLSYASARQ